MTTTNETRHYWKYQVKSSMAGMPRQVELLVAKVQGYTKDEAIAYCVQRWGNRFILDSLSPYVFPKDERAATSTEATPQDRKLWEVKMKDGTNRPLISHKRSREQAEHIARVRYGKQVLNVVEYFARPR